MSTFLLAIGFLWWIYFIFDKNVAVLIHFMSFIVLSGVLIDFSWNRGSSKYYLVLMLLLTSLWIMNIVASIVLFLEHELNPAKPEFVVICLFIGFLFAVIEYRKLRTDIIEPLRRYKILSARNKTIQMCNNVYQLMYGNRKRWSSGKIAISLSASFGFSVVNMDAGIKLNIIELCLYVMAIFLPYFLIFDFSLYGIVKGYEKEKKKVLYVLGFEQNRS